MKDIPEDRIAAVLAKTSDPRELAIAYLRAVDRAARLATDLQVSEAARNELRKATKRNPLDEYAMNDVFKDLFKGKDK